MAVVATIRPACDGLFGPCLAVEEGTTNGIAGRADFQTGWNPYGGASFTVTPGQIGPYGGTEAYRIQTSGGTTALKYYTHYGVGTTGQSYAVSCYVAVPPDAPTVRVSMQYGQTADVLPGTGWQRVELTAVGNGASGVQLRFEALDPADDLDFYAYGPQIEERAFATSFVDGTRSAPLLKYSIRDFLKNPVDWTLAFWVQPKGAVTASGERPVFWCLGHYTNPASADYHYLGLSKNDYDGSEALQWQAVDGQTQYATAIGAPAPFPKDAWHLVVCVWNKSADIRRLYVDGVEAANGSLANYRSEGVTGYGTTAGVAIGHLASNSTYPANALFSNVLTLPYAVDAATVKEWYDLQKPFFDPAPRLAVPTPTNVGLSVV